MKLKMRTHEEMKAYVEGYNACNKRFRECLKDRKSVVDAVKTMDVFIATVNGILKNSLPQGDGNMAIKALKQEPCEDCISREAVLETIEDCNSDGLKGIFCSYRDGKRFEKYIKELPSVTPKQEPCEDAISRQEVLDALDNHKYFREFCEEHHIDWSVNLDMARIAINNLSSVTPKEKRGDIDLLVEEAIKALEQEPCEDAISRKAVLETIEDCNSDGLKGIFCSYNDGKRFEEYIKKLPPVAPKEKTGCCKDCKYFEYDRVAKVNGIPLIIGHEICSRWGDGCKTKEDGYCFLFEPQESEEG